MSKNYINVSVSAGKPTRVSVSTPANQQNVDVTRDTSAYNAEIAKQWATSENLVLNEDYSAKHYAKEAKKSEQNAESFESATRETYNSFVSDANSYIEELIKTKDEVTEEINATVTNGKDEINSTKTTIINDIEFVADGEKKEIEELAENAKDDIKSTGFYMRDDKLYFINSEGEEQEFKSGGGGGLEIGDIGIAPLGIDETKGKRRYLNGQLIIQEQYVEFTNKVKSAIALYPSLACTESEWQTTATMTVGGQVGKFVVDDEAGTIRLPKIIMPIQGLTDLSKLGEIVEAGLPNITGQISDQYDANTLLFGELAPLTVKGALYVTDYSNRQGISSAGSYNMGTGISFDASLSNPIYGNSTTVQQEQIQYPYFIQVATGAETEDNIINEIELNNPFSLLDYKYSEYELNNLSWLRSNGQYNSKAIYPSVYELLLKIYNGTETKAGVSVKLSTGSYTDYDFVLNTSNETFRLPIKVKQKFLNAINGNMPVVGNGKSLGITTGANDYQLSNANNPWALWLANGTGATVGSSVSEWNKSSSWKALGVTTDASKSGLIAKVSQTEVSGLYLYFYVGAVAQNAPIVNLGRIQENMVTRPMVDGQWQKPPAAIELFSTTKLGTYEIDLSAYIPNDGYSYEVIVCYRVESSASNSNIYVSFKSSLTSNIAMGYIAGADRETGAITFPISTDRKMKYMLTTGTNTTTVGYSKCWLSAYRRLGTNQ